MKIYAQVNEGIVREIIKVKATDSIDDLYHPDFVATCFTCDGSVKEGYLYDGDVFSAPPEPLPSQPKVVSRRQFKMQLAIAGLSDQVSEWVAQQSQLIQIAFNESGTFNLEDEMLQQGFADLGFTSDQVSQFFSDASTL